VNPYALRQKRWRVERFANIAKKARALDYINRSITAGLLTEQQADKLRRGLATGDMTPDSVLNALQARWESSRRQDDLTSTANHKENQ
jgi:hypothetical protein